MRISGKKLFLLIAGGLAAVSLVIFYLFVPSLVHDAIVSQAAKSGLQNLRLRLVAVGLGRLDLADVSAGPAALPSLRIRKAVVNYTPLGLLRQQFRAIRLDGVVIRLEEHGQGLRFPGWTGSAGGGAVPALGRLDLTDGRILLQTEDRELDIPFTAHGSAIASGYVLHAGLHPMGIGIRLLGTFDRQFSSGAIEFSAPAADLSSLARLAGRDVVASGRVALYGKIGLKNGQFDRADIKADGSGIMALTIPDQGEFELDSLRLAFAIDGTFVPRAIVARARGRRLRFGEIGVDSPFYLDIRGRRWPELEFSLRRLCLARPLPLLAERIAGKTSGPWGALKVDGDFRLIAGSGLLAAAGLPWSNRQPYALDGMFQASRQERNIVWSCKAAGDGGVILASGKERLRGRLKLDAALEGDERGARVDATWRLANADAALAGGLARAGAIAGDARLRYGPDGGWSARGSLQLRDASYLAAGGDGLRAEGISVRLPWVYPGSGTGDQGSFVIDRLQNSLARGRDISGILTQEGQGLSFSGLAHSGLSGLTLSFKGNFAPLTGAGPWQAEFLVPSTVIAAGTSLEAIDPRLQGITAGGRFAARGSFRGAGDEVAGSASLELADGSFDLAGQGLAVSGVEAGILLESVFDLRSAPGQRLRFKELHWQGGTFRDGEVVFRAERSGLTIESGSFLWSGGLVRVDPMRLEPGATDIRATLRCRDVDLTQLINALAGSEVVSGEARVSGVVPLKLVNGSPLFLDGLLESTPGQGGQLRVAKPELISGGQVLVEEAIRDFNYKWIQVRLDSSAGRLNMVVSIDGAPARKLPLRYDQKKKDLVRDPSGQRHVELKGLQLDIRFDDIDLKDLLETSGKMTAGQK
jgi:hypothetical protein